MNNLLAGGNTALGSNDVEVIVNWSPTKINGFDVDTSAFLLTETGKVRGDHDFVFYNQPQSDNGSVSLSTSGSTHTFQVKTSQLPPNIVKIAFALSGFKPSASASS